MQSPLPLFYLAALAPLPLLAAAMVWGGPWGLLAVLSITVLAAGLDAGMPWSLPSTPAEGAHRAADALSVLVALGCLAVLFGTVAAVAAPGLGLGEKLVLYLGAGLYLGQIGNANAHELVHRGRRALHALGVAVYTALLFGHHASAHPLVHHVHVATRRDPNSARLGESYYGFFLRAWAGSFRAGLAAETARHRRAGRPVWRHPYGLYLGGAAAALALAWALGGGLGALVLLGLAGFAQSQLLLSDYVQHYGLVRRVGPDGRAEPVSDRHSWNAPHWYSSAMMLNAPRHSDHHAHPARPYPALTLPPQAPTLPYSLPVMACLALVPPLWRRVMDQRLRDLAAAGGCADGTVATAPEGPLPAE